jgi:hypothetical protein
MRLELERRLELFFQKANYHLSSSCVFSIASLLLMLKKTFVAVQFVHKFCSIWLMNEENIGKGLVVLEHL